MPLPEFINRTRQALDITGTPEALPGFGTTLAFNLQFQEADFWCWAAVASSVSKSYKAGSSWTQCAIANAVLPNTGNSCCVNKTSPVCNRMWKLETALDQTQNFQSMKFAPATFPEIQAAIRDNRRFLACGILWADATGHFVTLYGFSIDPTGIQWVAVADPKYGYSEYTYTSFLNHYRGAGSWRVSYLTRP